MSTAPWIMQEIFGGLSNKADDAGDAAKEASRDA